MTVAGSDLPTVPGARSTRQRLALATAMASTDAFRSARQWHEALVEAGHSVGLTTVYRTLQALVDAGEVDVIVAEDGESNYRRCSTGHHHHLVCRGCGTTIEVSAPDVERWATGVATEHGFVGARHMVEISGLCRECSASSPASNH